MAVEEFWRMTPREVMLAQRAATRRRFDALDDLTWAAWHTAVWHHVEKMPPFEDVMPSRALRRPARLTVEQDIARFERFFARAGKAN